MAAADLSRAAGAIGYFLLDKMCSTSGRQLVRAKSRPPTMPVWLHHEDEMYGLPDIETAASRSPATGTGSGLILRLAIAL